MGTGGETYKTNYNGVSLTPSQTSQTRPYQATTPSSSKPYQVPSYAAPAVTTPTLGATPAPTLAPLTVAAPAPIDLTNLTNKYMDSPQINQLYDQQKNSQLAQLKAQQDAAVSKINQQKADTQTSYYNQRNQADVVNQQNVNKMREIMAANGINASGENITAMANLSSQRQGALNNLNVQEQGKMNDFTNQINDINNPSRQQSIVDQIEAARTKALIDAQNQAQAKAWQEYAFNNLNASQLAQLAMSKYQTDSTNAANAASNQAALDYYNSGFNGSQGGGGSTSFQNNMAQAVQKGVPSSWVPAMTEIARRESSWNPSAKNPSSGTYGYAQFQPYNITSYDQKYGLDYANNPVDQLVAMYHYISDRYGNAQNALDFWNKNGWY